LRRPPAAGRGESWKNAAAVLFLPIRDAAAELHVHPNTLRYRIRRAEQLTGLDLRSPEQRLLAMLQLRL